MMLKLLRIRTNNALKTRSNISVYRDVRLLIVFHHIGFKIHPIPLRKSSFQ